MTQTVNFKVINVKGHPRGHYSERLEIELTEDEENLSEDHRNALIRKKISAYKGVPLENIILII